MQGHPAAVAFLVVGAFLWAGCSGDQETQQAQGTQEAKRVVSLAIGNRSVKLILGGMHCEGCATAIQNALTEQAGVVKSEVSFADSVAVVLYNKDQTSPADLVRAVEETGYRATPAGEPVDASTPAGENESSQ